MKNNNDAIIRRLISRTLKFNKKRNLFIIIAITLTMLLIAFVFSIGMSLIESKKMEEIRFSGTVAHAAVGHPNASQLEQLKSLDYVQIVGTNNNVGFVKYMGNISLTLHYFDKTEWGKLRAPACTDIVGNYPQKENEIMVSRGVLERLGINNPTIGMEIPLTYYTNSENSDALIRENFLLSGWYTSYSLIQSMNQAGTIFVSKELSLKYGKTIEADGSASLLFNNASRASEYCDKLKLDLGVSEDQPVVLGNMYDLDTGTKTANLIALSTVIAFLILTGYLLIFNVLYISISKDVRYYGLLKTLGTTPKQIKRIVIGQVMRLCMIGIPTGAILALLLSLVAVPVSISNLGAVSTGAVVSFSPFIYLGATFFALLTALLGAFKPAIKAASISPIEAQKFTGMEYKKDHSYKTTHATPYIMAFRNIFRDKKRAAVVLLSLFLGITTFITITTLVSSMGIESYIEFMYESDFILKNNILSNSKEIEQRFDHAYMEKLTVLPGFERLEYTTMEAIRLDYVPEEFGQYVADFSEQNNYENLTEDDVLRNFWGFIIGVDGEALMKLNETLEKHIDIDAFIDGEFALIASDNSALFSNVHDLTISPFNLNDSALNKQIIPLGGFIPFSWNEGGGMAPTIFVSNTLMTKIYTEPLISEVKIEVKNGYEHQALLVLNQITSGDHEISLTSKIEALEELKSAMTVLYVLGGGIALIIALIGILNFVNVMSTGIMVRKHELATLESIGMSRQQVRKLLVSEGLGYAVITLLLVYTIGSAFTLGIFALFRQQATYAVFTYPFILMVIVSLAIVAICVITPKFAYHSIYKATIVERLRETE